MCGGGVEGEDAVVAARSRRVLNGISLAVVLLGTVPGWAFSQPTNRSDGWVMVTEGTPLPRSYPPP